MPTAASCREQQRARALAPQVAQSDAALLRETISRQYSETNRTETGRVVIEDKTGRAKVKKAVKGVSVVPSGGI